MSNVIEKILLYNSRRLHHRRHLVLVEEPGPGPDRSGTEPSEIQHRKVFEQLLQRHDEHRLDQCSIQKVSHLSLLLLMIGKLECSPQAR